MRRAHLLAVAVVTALAVPGLAAPAQAAPVDNLTEGFDDITTLDAAGWSQQNLSSPIGLINWFQGNAAVFPAHTGVANAYIGANFNNTAGTGTISNWLLTPELSLTKGSKFTFWTRAAFLATYADRLEIRLSTEGSSTDVGATADSVGAFDTVVTQINPDLVDTGYPSDWTQYTVTVGDVPPDTTGRIGFRYFVTNAGPTGSESNYIGIDTVNFETAPTVTSVTPDFGRLAGGTEVTITGTRFAAGATATINGVVCTSPTVVSATTVTCTTGAGTAGTGGAVVTNLNGLSGSGGTFTYGTPGPLEFTPTPADFGTVTAGTAATPRKVTVRNTGSIPLAPSAIVATPAEITIDDSAAGSCRVNTAIPVGGQCDVTLGWTPAAVGTLAGDLTIDYPDGVTAASTLQVLGTAVPAKPAPPGKLKLKTSTKQVKASWKAVSGATNYQAVLKGKKASSAKKSSSLESARLTATKRVSKSKTVSSPKAVFKVKLKPGTRAKVCVTASNTSGTSPKVCATKKVPKKKKKK